MDKNKFWPGGRLFNTASPTLGAPTQWKARPEDGRPNTTQDTSASWAPQRNTRHIHKLGAPMHIHNENARHVRTSASWAPQRNARHVRKMVAQTQKIIRNENVHRREHYAKRRAGGWIRTNFGLEVDFLIRPHQVWAPQRNARHVRKMVAQTQNSSARKTSTQGSTRLKDELEDG